MDEMVGCRPARPVPLAAADLALGRPLCPRTAYRGQLAAGSGDRSRLQRLLLLYLRRGTQVQIRGHATLLSAPAEVGPGRPAVVGARRYSHQAVRPEGPGRRHPSQSHARTGQREVRLRPHLDNTVVGRAASAVGDDRAAPVGRALCATQNISALPTQLGWEFQTKLQQGADLVAWAAKIAWAAGKRLWVVADGAYAKRAFLKPLLKLGVVVVSRLRKDAHLNTLPAKPKKGQRRKRGRQRKYGTKRISLAKRAAARRGWKTIECVQYGKQVVKRYKSFLATYRPAYGTIRVVIVQEATGPQYFFCTDPNASVTEILEAFADRAAIEQDFHDLKVIWGVGQQQLRNLWANIGAYHLCLWMHSLVELWAWGKSKVEICDRCDSPWDDPSRRPSHADRRKALRHNVLQLQFLSLTRCRGAAGKIAAFVRQLVKLAV